MEGFKSNLSAINAARKQFGAAWKEHCGIEKLDGLFFVQIKQIDPARDPIGSIVSEREGAFAFPMAADMAKPAQAASEAAHEAQQAAARAFFASRQPSEESPKVSDATDATFAEQQRMADRIANAQASEQALPNGKVWIHRSSIEKPTKRVWAIADEMHARAAELGQPAPTRKEVQDECVRRGIASGTSRTQYQAWKTARDNARDNAAHAAELSAKLNGR